MSETVKEIVFRDAFYSCEHFHAKARLEELGEALAKVPEQFRDSAILEHESKYINRDEEMGTCLTIWYKRPLTEQELEERRSEELAKAKDKEEREWARYEELKAKFEPRRKESQELFESLTSEFEPNSEVSSAAFLKHKADLERLYQEISQGRGHAASINAIEDTMLDTWDLLTDSEKGQIDTLARRLDAAAKEAKALRPPRRAKST